MKLSLIVPTIGRPLELHRFIRHLEGQLGELNIELIVVDQSGSSETREMLGTLETSVPIRHLEMAGRGAARARNYGWSFASGELLTFPDDDCFYSPGLLTSVISRFDTAQVDCLMVQVEHLGRQDQIGGAITRDNVLFRCVESGMFVRRMAVANLRYDERMGVGASTLWNSDEGPDLLLRMLENGLRIEYDPSILIHHPNPLEIQSKELLNRSLIYARGRGYLLRKHHFS